MWSDGLSRLSDLDGGARVSRGNGKATGIDRDWNESDQLMKYFLHPYSAAAEEEAVLWALHSEI